jgi:tRNA modification GTPase
MMEVKKGLNKSLEYGRNFLFLTMLSSFPLHLFPYAVKPLRRLLKSHSIVCSNFDKKSHGTSIHSDEQSIFNLSTVPGKSGVAIIRVSGADAINTITSMTSLNAGCLSPRHLYYTKILHPATRRLLDICMLVFFKGPHTFTGEDIVEIHCHGSIAVTKSILEALHHLSNYRLSEPGEFTKRSFYNSKMDLTEVEALSDLIEAETACQHALALSQLGGHQKSLYESWRESCIFILANLEAFIDFAEDDNIESSILESTAHSVLALRDQIDNYLKDERRGEILRSGIQVAIIGPPNAGKSSMINMLNQKKMSIVSPIPGTTRDIVETTLDFAGFPLVLADTAGIRRHTDDPIEREGINLSLEKSQQAHIRIIMLDIADACGSSAISLLEMVQTMDLNYPKINLFVLNKHDLIAHSDSAISLFKSLLSNSFPNLLYSGIVTTCLTGMKPEYANFIDTFQRLLHDRFTQSDKFDFKPMITRARHRQHLLSASSYLTLCLDSLPIAKNLHGDIALATENCRQALLDIGKITGAVSVEQILDTIFKNFCIGK